MKVLRDSAPEAERTPNDRTDGTPIGGGNGERGVDPRFKETFFSILGHDLRNPLSAITTAAELLEMRADSEKIAKPVSRILQSADRMERIISQLLDFAHLNLGDGLALACAEIDLSAVARAVVSELTPPQHNKLVLHAAGDCRGSWDEKRMAQLISHLLCNACEHGSGDAVGVSVDGTAADDVLLEVLNRGKLPAEVMPVLFEPLREKGVRDKGNGTSGLGLGLYLARQIATAHGGTIRVESMSNNDETRFVVKLPRRR